MSIDQTTAKQKSVPAAARFFAGFTFSGFHQLSVLCRILIVFVLLFKHFEGRANYTRHPSDESIYYFPNTHVLSLWNPTKNKGSPLTFD